MGYLLNLYFRILKKYFFNTIFTPFPIQFYRLKITYFLSPGNIVFHSNKNHIIKYKNHKYLIKNYIYQMNIPLIFIVIFRHFGHLLRYGLT